ncbi:MAG TPA: hypothetical protein VN829_13480, partial [Dongiaceae bacterium]|nr:hypothetical protein [Dongiaceae bacterium]
MKTKSCTRYLPATALVAAAFFLPTLTGLSASLTPSDLYSAVVQGDGALAYYRFEDSLIRNNINVNSGSLGAAGNLTNTAYVHAFPGAIVGDPDRS